LNDGRRIFTVGDAVGLIAALADEPGNARSFDLALHALNIAARVQATFWDVEVAHRQLVNALRGEGLL
jgi:hypothetical protein